MAYIGNQVASNAFIIDQFSGNSSDTTFGPLTFAPYASSSIAVFISGVYQSPLQSYTLNGNMIEFASAPGTAVNNILVLHLGTGQTSIVASDGSVTAAKMAANSVTTTALANDAVQANNILNNAVTSAKILDGAVTQAKLDPNIDLGINALFFTGS